MQSYLVGRVLQTLLCLVAVTVIVFALTRVSGDPALLMMGEDSGSKEQYLSLKRELGLDQPLISQYAIYMTKLAQGDFGRSWRSNQPALKVLVEKLPNTLQLATAAMLICLLLAVPVGVMSAVRSGSFFDKAVRTFAYFGQAVPDFWLGIMLILLFAIFLRVLPAGGHDTPASIVLPAVTLGMFPTAAVARLTRSSMLDVLGSEYVKMARAKGVTAFWVVWKHALRNAAIPVLTYVSMVFAAMLRGAVVTETVFNWPGIGMLSVDSIFSRDFPVVQAAVLVAATIYLGINLVVDVLYAYVDPRIRY